ncbi:MAG: hypothetical protein WAW69_15935 [Polaromonas sp.]
MQITKAEVIYSIGRHTLTMNWRANHIASFLSTIWQANAGASLVTYPKSYQQAKPQAAGTTESCEFGDSEQSSAITMAECAAITKP